MRRIMPKRIRRPLDDETESLGGSSDRDSRGRFTSGNRASVGNRSNLGRGRTRVAICEALSEARLGRIVAALVRRAERGDRDAARLLFERIDGRPRPEPDDERTELDLGELHDLESCAAAQRRITAAASFGAITLNHAERLARLVEQTAARYVDHELAERVRELEAITRQTQ